MQTFTNGDVIEGEWKDDKLDGDALFKNANGDVWVMKKSSLIDLGTD